MGRPSSSYTTDELLRMVVCDKQDVTRVVAVGLVDKHTHPPLPDTSGVHLALACATSRQASVPRAPTTAR